MKEIDEILESQIGNMGGEEAGSEEVEKNPTLGKAKYFGSKNKADKKEESGNDTPIRIGWIEMNREEFGERGQFYPEDWKFYIKAATVDDIKNWSSIDEERPDQVLEVLNEMLRNNLKIVDADGANINCLKINDWDRFFFLCKIREYTFYKGEKEISYDGECPNCEHKVVYKLNSNTLSYEMPDQDLINRYYDNENRCWVVDPAEYDVKGPVIKFYLPTVEKDTVIFRRSLAKARDKKKLNETFLKFLPWLMSKVSLRDDNVNDHFIAEAEGVYKSWNMDMFGLAEEILRNITVTQKDKLSIICPHCGEEVDGDIQFPDGLRGLFTVQGGRQKFGKK